MTVIDTITLKVEFFDDELALSDFINDLDNLVNEKARIYGDEGVSEHFLPMVAELLAAINRAEW